MVAHRLDIFPPVLREAPPPWIDPIQDGLAAVESLLRQVMAEQHEVLSVAIDLLFSSGGKRVRPAICLLSAGIFNADFERAVALAAGVEMMHTATLVHDDIIDGASLRRGAPTLNATWRSDAAVLAGDYLFARSANLVVRAEDLRIMELFSKTLMVILNGEIAQRFSRWQINREEYFERIYAKTAALFMQAAQSAAILGAADEASLEAMIEFGRSVGLAFQIVDDVLDIRGAQEKIGKPIGSDLRQGLFTLPVIYYAEAHPHDPDIAALLEAKDGEHPAAARLIAKVRQSGGVESALQEARELVMHSQAVLKSLPDSVYTVGLSALATALVERDM